MVDMDNIKIYIGRSRCTITVNIRRGRYGR